MRAVGVPQVDTTQSEDDALVAVRVVQFTGCRRLLKTNIFSLSQDPLSEETERLWKSTAETNAAAFNEVFHCVPSKDVTSWKEYKGMSVSSSYQSLAG